MEDWISWKEDQIGWKEEVTRIWAKEKKEKGTKREKE
jgi:hypothetical protein